MNEKNYRIGNATKFGMLSLALIFDAIQWLTPGFIDTTITAIAAVIFGIIFLENNALTLKGKGALKLLRIILPISELAIGNLPTIFFTVWVQIKISRIADEVAPDALHNTLLIATKHGIRKDIIKNRNLIRKRTQKMRRVANKNISRKFGKGRRGEQRAMEEVNGGL